MCKTYLCHSTKLNYRLKNSVPQFNTCQRCMRNFIRTFWQKSLYWCCIYKKIIKKSYNAYSFLKMFFSILYLVKNVFQYPLPWKECFVLTNHSSVIKKSSSPFKDSGICRALYYHNGRGRVQTGNSSRPSKGRGPLPKWWGNIAVSLGQQTSQILSAYSINMMNNAIRTIGPLVRFLVADWSPNLRQVKS